MSIGTCIVLVINFGLIYFFSGSIYYLIGIFYTLLSIILTISLKNTRYCYKVINFMVKNWSKSEIIGTKNGNAIMLSASFLVGAMKIGAAVGMFIEFGAILVIAFAIIMASGFWLEGYSSGMTLSGAYYIAKILVKVLVKIYQFINSIFDKIATLIVKLEFKFLGIEKR